MQDNKTIFFRQPIDKEVMELVEQATELEHIKKNNEELRNKLSYEQEVAETKFELVKAYGIFKYANRSEPLEQLLEAYMNESIRKTHLDFILNQTNNDEIEFRDQLKKCIQKKINYLTMRM